MDETEQREAPPKRNIFQRIKHLSLKSWLKALCVFLTLLLIGLGVRYILDWRRSIPPPLPQEVVSSVYYQLYYPSRMPPGYGYKKESATSLNGLVSYKFYNGKKVITVTQQALPKSSIDITNLDNYKLEGYHTFDVQIGKAASGQSVGNPTVLILTDTTIVTIRSNQGVTNDSVINLARNMKPAHQSNIP